MQQIDTPWWVSEYMYSALSAQLHSTLPITFRVEEEVHVLPYTPADRSVSFQENLSMT